MKDRAFLQAIAAVIFVLMSNHNGARAEPASGGSGVIDFDMDHGLVIKGADDKLELRMGALVQSRMEVTSDHGDLGFSLPILRPAVRARFGDLFRLFIQPELAGATPRLLDAAVDVSLAGDALSLRVGQWIPPFSRAFLTPLGNLLFPDLPVADAEFRTGRDTGLMLFGRHFANKLAWDIGVFNGNGINGRNEDRDFEAMARVVWAPFGAIGYDEVGIVAQEVDFRLALGAATAIGEATVPTPEAEDGDATVKNRWATVALDAVIQAGWFQFQAEYYQRQRLSGIERNTTDRGGYVQVGWTAIRNVLQLGARLNTIDLYRDESNGVRWTAEAVANVHASGNHLKLQLRLGVDHPAGGGLAERGTLQLQAFF